MPNIVITGRFGGGALFVPKLTGESGKTQYTCNIILDDGQEEKLEAAVKAVVDEKWNGKPPMGLQNYVVRKGEDPEFEVSFGHYYINAKANTVSSKGVPLPRPGTFIKRGGKPVTVEHEDDIIYPGCYIAAEVSVYGYDADKAKNIKAGVTVGLSKVLFLKSGPRLSSQTSAEDAFSGFHSEESDADAEAWLNAAG